MPKKGSGVILLRLFLQKVSLIALRLWLLFCLGTVAFNHAQPLQASLSHQPHFSPGYFVTDKQKVGFKIHLNGLVVQTKNAGSLSQLKNTVRNTLKTTQTSTASQLASVLAMNQRGLYRVYFTQTFTSPHLEKLAFALRAHPQVQQVYPILRRGSGQAYTDQHLVVTALLATS